jgi:hypothetical protein
MSGRITTSELTEQVTDILIKSYDNQEFVSSISSLKHIKEKPLAYHK